ncbi:MAG: 5'-nucleotidase C-terminal domain-containing protein [Bacteroidota bacterium]|nr:5'-nucleotidase C-terminal domain-containing protein [Bacteroidota bacterium]
MNNFKPVLIIKLLLVLLISSCNTSRHHEVVLKILETSDVHGAIFPHDFIRSKPMNHSLAQAQTYISKLKIEPGHEVILLDNGDILQGQPTVYYSNYEETDLPHICSEVMNYMEYDAATIGNHDIEAGHQVYDKVREEFEFPWLAANAVDTKTGKPYFKPYTIIKRKGVRIAILGMITPGIPKWLPENLWEGIVFNDMVETAREWVPKIMETEKPDLMIGLFHAGHNAGYGGGSDTSYLNDNASLMVAREVPGFDIVFIGHDHDEYNGFVKNNLGNNVLVLDPGSSARLIAQATVKMTWNNKSGNYTKEIEGELVEVKMSRNKSSGTYTKEVMGQLIETKNFQADPNFLKEFNDQYNIIESYVSREVGVFEKALHSSDALFRDNDFMELIHQVQLDVSGASISFAAPLSMNAIVDSGNVYVRDMFQLYRFENFLYTIDLSGKEIHDYLEYSYSLWFNTMHSASDHLIRFVTEDDGLPKRFEKNPTYRLANSYYSFDSAEGINYIVDVSRPFGERIEILSLADGSTFDTEARYNVALNSYRGNGGGGHLTEGAGIPVSELPQRILSSTSKDLRYYMMRWIEKRAIVSLSANNNWKTVPEDWWIEAAKRDREMLFGR